MNIVFDIGVVLFAWEMVQRVPSNHGEVPSALPARLAAYLPVSST